MTGTAAPVPLDLNLRVVTRRLDLAPFDPYVTSHLNTKIAKAALTMNGAVALDNERKVMRVSYRGDAALVGVGMLDKVTNDSFLAVEFLRAKWDQISAWARVRRRSMSRRWTSATFTRESFSMPTAA